MQEVINELKKFADKQRAIHSQRYFKTGKGEYGENDKFIGVGGVIQRKIAQKFFDLDLSEVQKLLNSPIHEYRQTAVLILAYKYKKADDKFKKQIYNLYLKNTKNINNWDIVDISAPNVVGLYLVEHNVPRNILYKLAKSKNLWEKRIAIISTFAFIRQNDFKDTIKISEILLQDKYDLIHKAVGWMLREVGNRDRKKEESFLQKYYQEMPRTMLRYAIEKFPENLRQKYLKGQI